MAQRPGQMVPFTSPADGRCGALTVQGKQCRNQAVSGGRCGVHQVAGCRTDDGVARDVVTVKVDGIGGLATAERAAVLRAAAALGE